MVYVTVMMHENLSSLLLVSDSIAQTLILDFSKTFFEISVIFFFTEEVPAHPIFSTSK